MSFLRRKKAVPAPPPTLVPAPAAPVLALRYPLFTPEEQAQMEPEAKAIPRLLQAKTMPWETSGPPWICGLTLQRVQTLGRKHYQATTHEVSYSDRGAECTVCGFKAFREEVVCPLPTPR
jgi:hypothetical protein